MATQAFPRLKPVPEKEATGEIARIYQETRDALGIPWTAAIFQGYATYPALLRLAWDELQPNVVTGAFRGDSRVLRGHAAQAMERIYRPGYEVKEVRAWGADPEQIRELLDTFNYGNPKLLLCATAIARGLEGRPGGATGELAPAPVPPEEAAIRRRNIEMVDAQSPPADVASAFEDIKRTLNLPLVNSDYRALARWPEYLRRAWQDLKPVIGSGEYRRERDLLAHQADAAVDRFGSPVILSGGTLAREGVPEGELDNVVQIARLFYRLLPGLILNVEGFKRALTA